MNNEDMDDIKAVMNSLRHHCDGIVSIKKAIPVIAEKTGLSEDRIKHIIKLYFKG